MHMIYCVKICITFFHDYYMAIEINCKICFVIHVGRGKLNNFYYINNVKLKCGHRNTDLEEIIYNILYYLFTLLLFFVCLLHMHNRKVTVYKVTFVKISYLKLLQNTLQLLGNQVILNTYAKMYGFLQKRL